MYICKQIDKQTLIMCIHIYIYIHIHMFIKQTNIYIYIYIYKFIYLHTYIHPPLRTRWRRRPARGDVPGDDGPLPQLRPRREALPMLEDYI